MENKALELLKKIRPYVRNGNGGAIAVHAVYISPAQQLRNQADEMEAKERLLYEVDQFLMSNK
jgi:hypothetical protein